MRKIPTLFVRDPEDRRYVTRDVTPGCEWVLAGEGLPTRKYDGTCCLVRDGKLYKRYEVKKGKTPPPDFEPADEVDDNTGKQPGWVPVGNGPEDKYHREAFESDANARFWNGETCELIGPKVQGNPEKVESHWLILHSAAEHLDAPRDFEELREWLTAHDFEGIVWHHPDGRMVKLKKRDFPS